MTPKEYFSVAYTLMAEQVGGVGQLEAEFVKWMEEKEAEEYAASPARMAPDRKVPEKIAQDMKAVMQFAAPAPLREEVTD